MKLWIAAMLFAAAPLSAQWTFQVSVGEVANLETSLEIRQEGSPTIELDGDYESQSFTSPLYYSLRAGRSGWELELIHQKLFLENRPPEVQRFDISHGFNLVTIAETACVPATPKKEGSSTAQVGCTGNQRYEGSFR